MKKCSLIATFLLVFVSTFAQYNKIDTSFFSESLQENKMVDVYFPPGYDENPDLFYPVIYYLHGWGGNQNTMGSEMMVWAQSLIEDGTIEPVIMVGADNSPDYPFNGSMYTNSILWGDYEDYMVNDLILWIESSFRAVPSRNYRALLGHSMGGYGCWRFGTLHKNKFKALAATAAPVLNLTDSTLSWTQTKIIQQCTQSVPPYFYNFNNGSTTMGMFLFCGAFCPNLNTPQTYIDPPIVEFALDENGNYIDTIVDKLRDNSIDHLIQLIEPSDSLGILFGCGAADLSYYQNHLAFQDSLDLFGLPYEYYSHNGGHTMPSGFKERALIFIDSLLMPPIIPSSTCLPEGITFTNQEEIDNFQTNYPNCTEIEGTVFITGNNVTNLEGLNAVISIVGDLSIYGNENLINLSGLESLTTVDGYLRIGVNIMGTPYGNPVLTGFSGLNNLSFIGMDLFIEHNPMLVDLSGLNNLNSVNSISIRYNDSLSSLTGLDQIDENLLENLSVHDNVSLYECEIQSICNYLNLSPENVFIGYNAPGCNSPEEVEEACLYISVPEINTKPDFKIYPSPVGDFATLSFEGEEPGTAKVSLYNSTGVMVKTWQFKTTGSGQNDFVMDLSGLPSGIYLCRMQVGDDLVTRKMIKQ